MNKAHKIKKFLNWQVRSKPHIDLTDEYYAHLQPFRYPFILTVLVMLIGTLGYIFIEDYPLMDAIYQTGITFTTVGFGEQRPLSDLGRIFTITLIIFGFILFSMSVGVIADVFLKGKLQQILRERRMLFDIARLKQHFVVCYHNDFTKQVTKELRANHIPFVVVDPCENMEEIAKKYHYPYYISAEPHTQEAILKSYLSSAKGVIVLAQNVTDNIAIIASVRLYEDEIKRKRKYLIISNANSSEDEEKLIKLGADKVVTATKLMAQRVNAMAVRPNMENLLQDFLYKQDTPLDIEEIKISKRSWLTLLKIKDAKFKNISDVKIIGLRYKDSKFIAMPSDNITILPESKLLFVGTSDGIAKIRKIIRKKERPEGLKYV
jgi:voltage-gated potassium channel